MRFIIEVLVDDIHLRLHDKNDMAEALKFAVSGQMHEYRDGPWRRNSADIDFEVNVTIEEE